MNASFTNCRIDAAQIKKEQHLLINISLDSQSGGDYSFSFKSFFRKKGDQAYDIQMSDDPVNVTFNLPILFNTYQLNKKVIDDIYKEEKTLGKLVYLKIIPKINSPLSISVQGYYTGTNQAIVPGTSYSFDPSPPAPPSTS